MRHQSGYLVWGHREYDANHWWGHYFRLDNII